MDTGTGCASSRLAEPCDAGLGLTLRFAARSQPNKTWDGTVLYGMARPSPGSL